MPAEVLFDNAKALVEHHDAATREVRFNALLHAFARCWGFSPRACAPYRVRTKGKDERGVGYVKRNAIAGRRFASSVGFVAHLEQWNREIADVRLHGTTGELPLVRFADGAGALRPLGRRAPCGQRRDLIRKVRPDCAIDLGTNSYSVPWRLVGETVQVVVLAGCVIVRHPARSSPTILYATDAGNGSSTGRTWQAWWAPVPSVRRHHHRYRRQPCCGRSPSTRPWSEEAGDEGDRS